MDCCKGGGKDEDHRKVGVTEKKKGVHLKEILKIKLLIN